jgi:hypothetical protein
MFLAEVDFWCADLKLQVLIARSISWFLHSC